MLDSSSNFCPSNDTSDISDNDDSDNASAIIGAIEQLAKKEKKFAFAAELGRSLLNRNYELKNRNEFLEEALNTTNDMVVQLRHDLQARSNLLHFYMDYEIDADGCSSGQSNSENLQRKIKRLEDENQSLKKESINLKKIFSEYEENEQLNISEWTKQLDTANEKISNLQHLLAEKTEECGIQNLEVERLLKEVTTRSIHEKTLTNEAADLQIQLQDALAMHEELAAQVNDLQERYTEVLAMLRDANEELRTYRQNESAYRTSTPDSLYDSLASEIEASDTGFYSAINNQKLPTKQQNVQSVTDMTHLSNKLEMIEIHDVNNSNVVETRTVATVTDPLPSDRYQQNSHCDDNVVDVPNQIFAKLLRHSCHPHSPISFLLDINDSHKAKSSSISKSETKPFEIDASSSTSLQSKQSSNENNVPQNVIVNDLNRIQSDNSNSLSKTESNDSLSGYEGPKMGEPGRPGTRDLEWSIKKLNIRRQIEREYRRFRRERGLLPSNASFFNISSSQNSMKKYHWPGVIRHETLLHSDELQKHEFTNDLSRVFKRDKILSNVGLLASLHNNLAQGIVHRSTIPVKSSISTPLQQKLKNFTRDTSSSSSYLLEALNLCIPAEPLSLSLISKQLTRFHSMHNLC
uniref:HAP1 N-terminal domain-containing protein n=2 Tax=Wuchereria bancrofti TaxID=6293 RepID=A0AAF5RSX1_WUCBA